MQLKSPTSVHPTFVFDHKSTEQRESILNSPQNVELLKTDYERISTGGNTQLIKREYTDGADPPEQAAKLPPFRSFHTKITINSNSANQSNEKSSSVAPELFMGKSSPGGQVTQPISDTMSLGPFVNNEPSHNVTRSHMT